ncbi:THUMP domain-containing protein [Marinilabiliaceae bacterium ANBcel2]|nr:THUMP domain-containing protein [Marinilabiliaceae bacterium ANBcel2]
MEFVAKTFHGLEDVLAQELKDLGADNVEPVNRAVTFTGDKELLYRVNLWSRTALRVLKPEIKFKACNEDQLYNKVKEIDWSHLMSNEDTLAIDPVVFSKYFTHSKYVAYKFKDAICDRFRETTGKRPSVDLKRPNTIFNVHVVEDQFTVSIDSSGESLNRRGYRTKEHPAPINEVLAAGMILISDWDKKMTFFDPMCGSGTIVMEAAMIAANIAPNFKRKEFAFQRWKDYEPELWEKIYNDAKRKISTPEARINGSDISVKSIDISRQSALDFGIKQYINFNVNSFSDAVRTGREGMIIMNPPYDERLRSADVVKLYSGIGERLKSKFSGWEAWIISSNRDALDSVGLKPDKKVTLFNGALECSFQKFSLYRGTKRVNRVKHIIKN